MPKMKTHKGWKKRVKITATGKVRYKRPFAGHLMSDKSGNRTRRLRRPSILRGAVAELVKRSLGS